MKAKLAILAYGNGTTAEACIRTAIQQNLNYSVKLVIVSRAKAGIFARIENLNKEFGLNIRCQLINHQTHPAPAGEIVERGQQTAAEEQAIIDALEAAQIDLIVLMGYMKRVGPKLVQRYGWHADYTNPFQAKMLNTHPGLLPETKGLYGELVQKHVLERNLPFSGQTLHVVAEEYDEGPVVAEHAVRAEPDDTVETLFARVQQAEKQFLPLNLDTFLTGRRLFLAGQERVKI